MSRTRQIALAAATAALGIATALAAAGSAGAQGTRIPGCTSISNVEAIIDDSGSMSFADPNKLRRSGMEIFITNQNNTGKTLGAVEFGSDANTIFGPGRIGASTRGFMIGQLRNLIRANNGGTDYDAAFRRAAAENPNAQARIFLTDGAHGGRYENSHRGGPRTFVVGLGIGPASPSDPNATRLQQIANETGGRYFPGVTKTSLQTTFNSISSAVNCLQPPRTFNSKLFVRPGQTSGARTSILRSARKVDLVLNWSEPGNKFGYSSIKALGRRNKVLATLSGKGKPRKLRVSKAGGETFASLTMRKPRGTRKLAFRVKALRVSTAETTITQLTQRR